MKDYSMYLTKKINNLSEDFIFEFKQNFYNNRRDKLLKIYSPMLTHNEIKALIQKLNLSKDKLLWYTDGKTDIKVSANNSNIIPPDFYPGRSNGCKINTKNFKWYNDGINNFLLDPSSCKVHNLVPGIITNSTRGYKFYNNDRINISLAPGENIPEGFKPGQISTEKRKLAGLQKRTYKYNNGENEISLLSTDPVPEGYISGPLTKEIKKTYRDNYYLNLGYIPLHVLKDKYKTISWFKHLPDLDVIKFKDPYIYVNQKEIPRIEKYIEECSSYGENELLSFLRSIYTGEIILHSRSILGNGQELDFYLPEYNLALEFDGTWYHSNWYKDNDYHLIKTKLCENKGIRLIHVFEDLWINSPEIYKSIISIALNRVKIKIYARQCDFREVSKSEEKEFLQKNHLQGYVNSTQCFGLYYQDDLVELISFGKNRFKKGEIELLRMCSNLDTEIVGGFSKLIKNSNIKNFISYVDRSIFTANGYIKSGFNLVGYSKPSYVYFYKGDLLNRLNRLNFQKHKLKDKLNIFNPDLTEFENMDNNGYLRVYDCGTIKLEFKGGDMDEKDN